MTKNKAGQFAKKECQRRGWPWQEPVIVDWGLFSFTVRTNARSHGSNVCIKVRTRDAEIMSAGMVTF
jgi:hypothetical protein